MLIDVSRTSYSVSGLLFNMYSTIVTEYYFYIVFFLLVIRQNVLVCVGS